MNENNGMPNNPQMYNNPPVYNNYGPQGFTPNSIPEEYKPISMWGYFGYELLFAIPFIGFIILVIMCFAPKNINLKNFARSYFCVFIIAAIVAVMLLVFSGGLAGFAALMESGY